MSTGTGFLEEAPGDKSSMRLMCFLSLLAAIGFGFLEVKAAASFPYVTTMFIVGAFAPKSVQKFAEKKT